MMKVSKSWLCAMVLLAWTASPSYVVDGADQAQLKAHLHYRWNSQEGIVHTRIPEEDALSFRKEAVVSGAPEATEKTAKGDSGTEDTHSKAVQGNEEGAKEAPKGVSKKDASKDLKTIESDEDTKGSLDEGDEASALTETTDKVTLVDDTAGEKGEKEEEIPSLLKGVKGSDLITDEEWTKRRALKPTYAPKTNWSLQDVGKGYTINELGRTKQPTTLAPFVEEIMKETPVEAKDPAQVKEEAKDKKEEPATKGEAVKKDGKAGKQGDAQEKKGESKVEKKVDSKKDEKDTTKSSEVGAKGPTITQAGPFITARKGTESFTTYAGVSRYDEPLHTQGLAYAYRSQPLGPGAIEEIADRGFLPPNTIGPRGYMTNIVHIHAEDEGRQWGRDIKIGSTRRELLFSFGVPQAMWRDNQDGSMLWLYRIPKEGEKLFGEKKENDHFAKNTYTSSSAEPAKDDVLYGVVTLRKGKVAALDLFDGPVWPYLQIPEQTLHTFEAGKLVDEDFRVMGYGLHEPFKTDPNRGWTEKGRLYGDNYIGYKDVAVAADAKGMVSRVLIHSNYGVTRRGISLGDSKYLLLFAYGMPDFEEDGDSVQGEGTIVYGYRHPYLTSTYLLFMVEKKEGGGVQSILLSDRLMKDLLKK